MTKLSLCLKDIKGLKSVTVAKIDDQSIKLANYARNSTKD